ncbi:hypothetical protein HBA55_02555 [Pseudomaricurvus alkylphenolicus]|uniref:hypothetical protein n=1 Tax=Pseudomaricurvus alkylphenolicus TaxID=1306991 RepID=UPI00141F8C82|nr:hypothetical protein [Pseudomaricurvus alkylphenolicus]NIB38446.1 hypothetical protein [Pseudomaricurvus alkylphenolicus]
MKITKRLLSLLCSAVLSGCGGNGLLNKIESRVVATESPFQELQNISTTVSVEQFEFQPTRIQVGTVYHFTISNRDKSYIKNIALYVADENKLESFKMYPGADHTVVVEAEMDWEKFSIKSVNQIEISKELVRTETLRMALKEEPSYLYVYGGSRIPRGEYMPGYFPATNHGFDFSDLNFAFRHLRDPRSDVEVGVAAPVPPGKLAYTGNMKMLYVGEESYKGRSCYRYSISGRGVGGRTGYLLVNQRGGHFEYMELDANYHPKFDYFRYELSSVSQMTREQWDSHVESESRRHFNDHSFD